MTLTLLVDLDDTLLGNKMGTFLPAYLQALARHLAGFASPEQLVHNLLAATQQMIQNQRPDQSLEMVFDAHFYPALGLERQDLQNAIDTFYAEVFPTLRGLTQPRLEALHLVKYALERGYRLAIATNPLFPRTAILQRLEWAGLASLIDSMDLITSSEVFHFTKPNLAYYAEIMAQLGWPEGPVVMVGDDLTNDITPARGLGLPAFWITPNGNRLPDRQFAPTASGELADFITWLENTPSEPLQPEFTTPPSILAILRATPAAVATLTREVPTSLLTECPKPGEWCLTEILCHLRDVEREVNLPRMKKVIEENNPFLPGMNTDPWAEERMYICQDGHNALTAFTQARQQLLDLLDDARPKDWERPARHAIFGPTQLKELASIAAGHDRLHLGQLLETLKTISFYLQKP